MAASEPDPSRKLKFVFNCLVYFIFLTLDTYTYLEYICKLIIHTKIGQVFIGISNKGTKTSLRSKDLGQAGHAGWRPSSKVTILPCLMAKRLAVVEIVEISYLICHVTLQNHMIKESCEFKDGSSTFYLNILPSLVVGVNVVVAI